MISKAILLGFTFIILCHANFSIEENLNLTVLSDTINAVIDEIYLKKSRTVNLIIQNPGQLVKEFVESLRLRRPATVFRIGKVPKVALTRKIVFSIFILENANQLEVFQVGIVNQIFKTDAYFVIVLIGEDFRVNHQKIDKIFRNFWNLKFRNVVVFHNDQLTKTYVFKIFTPFSYGKCNEIRTVQINNFENDKLITGMASLFPNNFFNMHNCPVKVGIPSNLVPFIFIKHHQNGSYDLSGQSIEVLNTLASSLNFKPNLTYVGTEGVLNENGTSTGSFKSLIKNESEFIIGNYWLKTHRLNFFGSSKPYTTEKIIFVIPPGKFLTSLEKLIYPFSLNVWLCIIASYIIACVVITTVKFSSIEVQRFVFGAGVRYPYLNLVIGISGGSQKILPKTNFARFLLMMFLMSSLVIRTLYQGSFFRVMHSENQREIQSLDEMIEKDFTLFLVLSMDDIFISDAIKNRFD